MDELVISLADNEAMVEQLSGLSIGDSLTGTISLKVNTIDPEMAKFDVESFSPDPIVSEAVDTGVAPTGEPKAPPAPSAVTNLFPGM